MPDNPRGLFITGTDTEVGKTRVAAAIAWTLRGSGRRVGVYKPVASGCRLKRDTLISDDAVALWKATGCAGELDRVCPQRFEAPLAPHLAARAEGKELDATLLAGGIDYWHASDADIILVEGVGGLMCPLGDKLYVADLALELGFPLVIVSRNALGTINHTLQTLMVAETYRGGLDVSGVVLNNTVLNNTVANDPASDDISRASNRAQLAAHCRVPILAELAWQADRFDEEVDWFELAR